MSTQHTLSFLIAVGLAACGLGGCVSGSIGQQVAQSLLMQAADKITWEAMEAQRRKDEAAARTAELRDTVPDAYWAAFLTSGFSSVPIQEPSPPNPANTNRDEDGIQVSRLVQVEIWNFIIGQEKTAILERLSQRGATTLPSPAEWPDWKLATGKITNQPNKTLYVLVPPELGQIRSGERAAVEIAAIGGAHIARHKLDGGQ